MEEVRWYFHQASYQRGIADCIRERKEMAHDLRVCISTDSQVKSGITEFATVIVFIRKGKGGFMYICDDVSNQKMTIKQRMLMEVAKESRWLMTCAICLLFTMWIWKCMLILIQTLNSKATML
jgi:uncharacterized protein